jgi:uncharacterized membrane protein
VVSRKSSRSRGRQPAKPAAKAQQTTVAQFLHSEQQFTGPLPPPEILRQYDEIVPGLAERMVQAMEAQTFHRHKLESATVYGNVSAQRTGQYFAGVLALAGVVGTVVLGLAGKQAAAAVLGGSDFVGLAGVFIYGRRSQRQERRDQMAALGARE